jgi:hypothetical protein
LAPGACVVAEHPADFDLPTPRGLSRYDMRRYGAVALSFLREGDL